TARAPGQDARRSERRCPTGRASGAVVDDAGEDRAVGLAAVVDDGRAVGVDDQGVVHAFQTEIAGELERGVDLARRGRAGLHANEPQRVTRCPTTSVPFAIWSQPGCRRAGPAT